MNPDNSDAGSRGTIRFLELGYPGNIAIASIQSQHDPYGEAVDRCDLPHHREELFSPHQLDEDHATQR